jgi:manganese/iron transport system substrate-binding protein
MNCRCERIVLNAEPFLQEMMHVRFPSKIVLTILAVLLASIGGRISFAADAPGPAPRIKVLAVETFLADMARNVAGDRLKVDSLLPVGADPHSFEPTPSDLRKVADSNVLIENGAGLEIFLARMLENAGGKRLVIIASQGLTARVSREGEIAEMGDEDLSEAMCGAAGSLQVQTVKAGKDTQSAAQLPSDGGLIQVTLAKRQDGTYSGFLALKADESGDFQVGRAPGLLKIFKEGDPSPLKSERDFHPKCRGLDAGSIVELKKDGGYIFALTGFKSEKASLFIGPAGGHHHEGDPHFWLDPRNAVQYVRNIQRGLTEADHAGAAVYAANADAYIGKLKDLDRWIAAEVDKIPPDKRLLVTNHESFGYFADHYDFRIIGTIVPSVSPDASPSARQLVRLTKRIKATGAKAIFLETGTNPMLAQQVAKETGIKVATELYDHSVSDRDGPAPTYIDMMKYDVKAITDALK